MSYLKTQVVEIIDPFFDEERARGHRLFSSLEGENPGGSVKDHMVLGELLALIKTGQLQPGAWVSELSAGSTAESLAHYCQQLKLNCALFLPTTAPRSLVESLQKKVQEVHLLELSSAYAEYAIQVQSRKLFPFDQLFDSSKKRHYHGFAQQVQQTLQKPIDLVVGAVGTGHSLLGTAAGFGEGTLAVSAEPGPTWKVAGCRNISVDRYGEKDLLTPECLDERVVLDNESEIYQGASIQTDKGIIEIGNTFALAVTAAKIALTSMFRRNVFLIGARTQRAQAISLIQKSA